MSDYAVLQSVSEVLRDLIWAEFRADQQIHPQFVSSLEAIEFLNPAEMRQNDALRLSLWIYHITENEFEKNQVPALNGSGRHMFPMALNLYYLVTPFGPSSKANHMILGKTMQVLYDNAIVAVKRPHLIEELRIIFGRVSLEELTRIWEALKEPYRLSVCYQVRVAHLDSERQIGTNRVLDRRVAYEHNEKPMLEYEP